MKKVALITGASAGLGVEFARQLSARGLALVLAARRKERLEELAKELGNARAVAIDLSKPNAAAKLMADLEGAGEEVEILVNNAGFGLIGRFAELDARRQRQMIDLNVGTLTDLCRAVAPPDDRAQVRRNSQRRVDRGLPARAENGGLLRDQGLRSVAERSPARGAEAAGGSGSPACVPGPPAPSSASSQGSAGTACSTA